MTIQTLTIVTLALAGFVSATPYNLHSRAKDVTITQLSKSLNSTGGEGNVAASGTLSPFGSIGVGCGVNWVRDVSYGGGLTAGSTDYGLGGGFAIAPENITIGLGIGINAANASANIDFSGTKDGKFELVFEASGEVVCMPGKKDGKSIITCKSA
ncbi:hypothetical protein T440DRAFT_462858 [Plenodomus tracheiphilus IPT5]|uniref:Uncharacterized protein n=1 Tax=Plenodomus tracheiphilus IPT5 TaxID=1408161 RepID=A0A6A7BMF8_9PLEO|nr:hypothetical protein T440DRAFT_462858 [Plenodomus tracheiphilus IPT5]